MNRFSLTPVNQEPVETVVPHVEPIMTATIDQQVFVGASPDSVAAAEFRTFQMVRKLFHCLETQVRFRPCPSALGCLKGHDYTWRSQPVVNRAPLCNMSGAILARQNGCGVYKHIATVDSHTSTVISRTLAAATCKQRSDINMCLLNPCSVCNKTSVLQDFVTDHNIDLMVLTETWLKGDDSPDNVILAELLPPGYTIKHNARQGCGGGVVIMHPSTLSVTRVEHSASSPPQ